MDSVTDRAEQYDVSKGTNGGENDFEEVALAVAIREDYYDGVDYGTP